MPFLLVIHHYMVDVFMINSSATDACVFMNHRRSVLAHQGTKQKGREMAFGVFVNNINQIRKDDQIISLKYNQVKN